jgi:hypothetical protein
MKHLNLTNRESTGYEPVPGGVREDLDRKSVARRPRPSRRLVGQEMKQSEEARKIVADRHADQVQAQVRRIEEEAERRKPRPSEVSDRYTRP